MSYYTGLSSYTDTFCVRGWHICTMLKKYKKNKIK